MGAKPTKAPPWGRDCYRLLQKNMQENHRSGQEESDIVATNETYTPLRKK